VVAFLIPWRPGDAHREAAWRQLRARHLELGRTVIQGTHIEGPWCKAAAIANALQRTDADQLVVHDADVWCDGVDDAIGALDDCTRWAIPHGKVYRLAEGQMEPSIERGALAQPPYPGWAGGGIVVIDRTAYESCPLDPRHLGWGQEDASWALALTALHGLPWRGDTPLFHWWHPPQPRRSRTVGSPEGAALHKRYTRSAKSRRQMLELIEEARDALRSIPT
jgi:hypothetical protein